MSDQKMVGVFLDERSVVSRSAQVDHERKVAIYDLIEENRFKLVGDFYGPYNLHLSIAENRLIFDVRDMGDNEHRKTVFSSFLQKSRNASKMVA